MVEALGPYRIVRRIAMGGMAEIYLARHHGIEGVERTVVVKRILPSLSDNQEFVTMFLDEARLMASLSHPNIAQVFDLGRTPDSYYLVMEHVRGPTLGAILGAATRSGGGVPAESALGIVLHIAQALDYVHGLHDEYGRPLNIVHRDLNPANVMVSYDGAVKLIDFGIAKAATKVYETRTGVIKGTYGYIAPEQLSSKTRSKVDHRADVFALGVLMYETCVGKHPFDASDEPNFLDRILNAAYKRPSEVVPGFPPALDRLIARCLAPHPNGRPESVDEVIGEIIAYMRMQRLVPTLGHIAAAARQLVPDQEGAEPIRSAYRPRAEPPSLEAMLDEDGTFEVGPPDDPTWVAAPPRADGTVRLRRDSSEGRRPPSHAAPPPAASLPPALDKEAFASFEPYSDDDLATGVRDDLATGVRGSSPPAAPLTVPAVPAPRSRPPPAPPGAPFGTLPAMTPPLSSVPPAPHVRPMGSLAALQEAAERPTLLRRVLTYGGSVLLVLLVGVLAFVTARAIGGPAREQSSRDAPSPTAAADASPGTAREGGVGGSGEERGTEDADPAAHRTLRVTSEPSGAIVFLDGERTPRATPASVEIDVANVSVWVRVAREGFITQEREVLSTAGEARFVLSELTADAGTTRVRRQDTRRRRRPPRKAR
jgi:serine/threonine-protein kinase